MVNTMSMIGSRFNHIIKKMGVVNKIEPREYLTQKKNLTKN